MMAPLKKDVIDAVLSGIIAANRFYSEITNGSWISDAGVENVMQSKIAEALFSRLNFVGDERWQIHLEHPILAFRQDVGVKLRGRVPLSIDGSKRLDLALFDEADRPRIPIEVKRLHTTLGLAVDLERVARLLQQCWTATEQQVDYGICCGFVVGNGVSSHAAEEKARDKIKAVCVSAGDIDRHFVGVTSQCYDQVGNAEAYDIDGAPYWVPAAYCICIERSSDSLGSASGLRNALGEA